MALELSMMQGPPLDRSFPLSFVMMTGIGLMPGPKPLWRFNVDYRKLILVILISRYGILEAVYSQVLKLGKKISKKLVIENRWWTGILLFGSQLPSLGMLLFFGLLFMMLLLLESICAVGDILEIVYAFFVMLNKRIGTI